MLIKCPECDLQVSDKAQTCPHCGYPMKSKPAVRKNPKHMRLPNGFGQISMIKNANLRNPWRAMICVGKDSNGRPISRLLKPQAYFPTYNDAYAALVEYNKNPYDLEDDITLKELYDRWSEEYFKNIKDSAARSVKAAWAYCSRLYDMRAKDIRAHHIKNIMEDGTVDYKGEVRHASPSTKGRIKSLFNLMLDYAVEYEIVERNYARTFEISTDIIKEANKVQKGHISFSESEMHTLWSNINIGEVRMILIQCYMGWRPQELCEIEIANVDIENWTIKGGMKTEAGEDRVVPIHSCIRNFVEGFYEMNKDRKYLFDYTRHTTYDIYRRRFANVMKDLGLNPDHRAHDPRKQFVTMAKKYQLDEYAIKRIIGHRVSDITEAVYTDRDPGWLSSEIEKIKAPV